MTFDDEVSFGGENNKYIDTIKELIVAIIIPPIVPPNKAAKDIRISGQETVELRSIKVVAN